MKLFPILLLLLWLPNCGPSLEIEWPDADDNANVSSESRPEWFRIIVLDVGQGDATLLIAPEGETALIDTGPPNRGDQAILQIMQELKLEKIDTIFISHYDQDHSGGLAKLKETKWGSQVPILDPETAPIGHTLRLGSVRIDIKAGNGQIGDFVIPTEERQHRNYLSLALLIRYKSFRYFTDGDLPGGGGNPPYQTLDLETALAPLVGDVDVLLVPHHGSHTSTNTFFLETLAPEIALLSLGDDNDYFHPHPSVIDRLQRNGIQIFQTEQGWLEETEGIEIIQGLICIITDGEQYEVKAYVIDKCAPPNK